MADDYDDPAFSGGNMDRPALKRMLADIEAGKIDVVVIYKIDRLTRSLADFSKMIEVFERYGVSFVSVTQQFNTTTSMGRLMLNILLSFAQFEREVTGERIRDKVAASKRKGIWMGGVPPLGYDVENRRLVPNEQEAKLVRHIFQRFVELGSSTMLVKELKLDGVTSKAWTTQDGKTNLGRGEDHRGHDPARHDLGSTVPGRADPDREIAGRESHRVAQRPRGAAARKWHRTPGAGAAPRAGRATSGSTGMSDIRIQKTGEPDILQTSDGRLTLSVPIQIKRRSGRKLVTLPNGETAPVRPWDVAPTSIQLALARGHRWLAMLESGEAKSLKEIATREGIDNSYVSRMVNLTTLAPDIVAAILDDVLPNHVTLFDLAVDPPALWDEQRERVGF